jgi:hypothetical protein
VLVVKRGRLADTAISLGITNGSRVEVTSGLTDTSLVVDTFSNALSPGEKVRFSLAKDKSALTGEARASLAKPS